MQTIERMSTSYPAVSGEVVTQAHADYCAERGHAVYQVAGVDQGTCPRCGVSTEENLTPEQAARIETGQLDAPRSSDSSYKVIGYRDGLSCTLAYNLSGSEVRAHLRALAKSPRNNRLVAIVETF